MSCEPPLSSRASACRTSTAPLWFVALLLALVSFGCGKKGDPLPPLRSTPAPTTDLSVHQQGSTLIFRLGYPQTTASGQTLSGLRSLQVWEMVAPVADPGRLPEVDARQFAGAAEPILSIEGAELDSSVVGNRMETRFPITSVPETPELHVFAIRTFSLDDEESDFSNLVRLVLRPATEPPQAFSVRPLADGVELTWQTQADAHGFHVYRRLATERNFGPPIAVVLNDLRHFVDEGARYDQRYIYTLRAIVQPKPLVETAASAEVEIDYRDRFAPAAPTELVALAETGRVRLVWRESTSIDTTGYIVYRRNPGESNFRRLDDDPVTETVYIDDGLTAGRSFDYRVTAVDAAGNEGEPSAVATAVPD